LFVVDFAFLGLNTLIASSYKLIVKYPTANCFYWAQNIPP